MKSICLTKTKNIQNLGLGNADVRDNFYIGIFILFKNCGPKGLFFYSERNLSNNLSDDDEDNNNNDNNGD